uniref:30S ribosomal protein S18 n=1 Tax=Thermus filiformis TaxID=276 RepID=UPI0038B5E81D
MGEFDLLDYKNVEVLRKFLSETGKILPRRRTGLTAKEQRILARTIKRARVLGLLPFTEKLVRK